MTAPCSREHRRRRAETVLVSMGEVWGAVAAAMTGEAGADLEDMLLLVFSDVIYIKIEYD